MKAVLTADIINSTKTTAKSWIVELKKTLLKFGDEGSDWEIYRGDEFQIITEKPETIFLILINIKAALNSKNADARFAIGLGEVNFTGGNIRESNGSAFIYSGRSLEILKSTKKPNLILKSDFEDFDENFNLIFHLLASIFNKWTVANSKAILALLQNPEKTQKDIADIIGVSQPALSKSLKRANIEEVLAVEKYFRKKIKEIS